MKDNTEARGDTAAVSARWDLRYQSTATATPHPAAVLEQNAHLLPRQGTALDLACGLGGNALFLAGRGLEVNAWDASSVAIERLGRLAAAAGVGGAVLAEVRDAVKNPPAPRSYDLIVVSQFLDRTLCPALIDALAPDGLMFYQTFTRERVDDSGPRNPAYRLAPNELLSLFPTLQLLVYREEGRVGDPGQGFRNRAMLVGRKIR